MSGEKDVNDVFEEILLSEDTAEKAGFEEGYEAGKKNLIQGYHLGYHTISPIAAQLGYFMGMLTANHQILSSPKLEGQVKKLNEGIQNFPASNDDSVDILQLLENIKSNFKRICSLAKINSKFTEIDDSEF